MIRQAIAGAAPGLQARLLGVLRRPLRERGAARAASASSRRVAVLARRLPRRKGIFATLVGTVFAHRMFDLFPTIALVVWVLDLRRRCRTGR